MTFVACRTDGPAVHADRPACPDRLNPSQSLARRNALWLFATEVGLHDSIIGRVRIHSVRELADLFGLTPQAVRDGIAWARSARRHVDEVAAGD